MFDKLTSKFANLIKNFSTKGMLSEKDIEEAIRNIRLSLLEADVSIQIIKDITETVKKQTTQHEKIAGLLPEHILLKIFKDKILEILTLHHKEFAVHKNEIIMFIGLQGSGKTTTVVKLAKYITCIKNDIKPLLVSVDTYRPAARDQLAIFAKQNNIAVFDTQEKNPIIIMKEALKFYKSSAEYNTLIIDTAGRSQINDEMLSELDQIVEISNPTQKILVADSMLGQESINIAKGFDKYVTGIILSRVDGDSRGGAALSFSYITQKPIFFLGTGEKIDRLELFYPNRIASKILGQGDLLSLAESVMNANENEDKIEIAERIQQGRFNLEDMEKQLKMMQKIGGMGKIINMIPMPQITEDKKAQGMTAMRKNQVILQSMTRKEKQKPEILNGSRKLRIAKGSGTTVTDINSLLNQYKQMQKMMRSFSGGMMQKMIAKMQNTHHLGKK